MAEVVDSRDLYLSESPNLDLIANPRADLRYRVLQTFALQVSPAGTRLKRECKGIVGFAWMLAIGESLLPPLDDSTVGRAFVTLRFALLIETSRALRRRRLADGRATGSRRFLAEARNAFLCGVGSTRLLTTGLDRVHNRLRH